MKCPNCGKEVQMLKDSIYGLTCSDCLNEFVDKFNQAKVIAFGGASSINMGHATQMQMYEAIGPKCEAQFLSETKGRVGVAIIEDDNKKQPLRMMRVGYYDSARKDIINHATFSCS